MNRGASASVQTEWAKSQNQPFNLLEMYFDTADGGAVYINDGYRTLSWNGNSYVGLGHFLGFSGITESAELRVSDAQVEISGVDQAYIAIFLQRKYLDRRLVIRKAFFDSSDAIIVDPVVIHDGRMDAPKVVEDVEEGTSVVQVASRDEFADFERLSGRHTNSAEQNRFFATDRCFDQLAVVNNRPLNWGHIKEPPATGLGAAASRLVHSVTKPLGIDL